MRWISAGVGASLSAQIGTLPIVAYHFHQFSLISLLINPSVMVLVTLIVSLALASLVLGLIRIKLAMPTAIVGQVLLWCFLWTVICLVASRCPDWRSRPQLRPNLPLYCLHPQSNHLPWILKYGQVFNHRSLIWGLLMVTILVWDFAWWSPGRYLKVSFLDVGQGNAVVIQFPDHKTMWVEKSHLRQRSTGDCPLLRCRQIRRINLVVLSHPANDHDGDWATSWSISR